ncbi:MAG TPA: MotA/TolQ/ExbB proton channel family protein [Phycisphaerales bacterium]|nr:MotA/TolQ/ExbB proton channel family protein [Phycisphaerales bacterium]
MESLGPLELFRAGGWVMYPLAAVSLLSVAICFERAAFWLRHREVATIRLIDRVVRHARTGDWSGAGARAEVDRTVLGRFARSMIRDEEPGWRARPHISGADAAQAIESVRSATERFSATLSAIITAAPMLGILGTVTGIISSFRLLGSEGPISDPVSVAGGIAEALITTAFGLIVALVTLFPYTIFRARADRCLARLEAFGESLIAIADEQRGAADTPGGPSARSPAP